MSPDRLIDALIAASKKPLLQIAAEMDKPSFQGTLHKFSKGQVLSPSHQTARKIADYFDLPIEAIYDKVVSTRIARERGITERPSSAGPAAIPQQLTLQEPVTATYRISSKPSRALSSTLLDRIAQLDAEQVDTVESLIKTYLDAVAPLPRSKAARA